MVGTYSVGDWIGGRFQVFDVHEGGMSLVFVVNDQLNGPGPKVVALKTLRSELLGSRIRISRFAAECRIWVQLGDHPNIVRAHAVEVIDGRPYVVLELIQGGDLNRWIGTRRLDLEQALRFGYQFCLGMEHALRQGLAVSSRHQARQSPGDRGRHAQDHRFWLGASPRRWWPCVPSSLMGQFPWPRTPVRRRSSGPIHGTGRLTDRRPR